MDAEVLFEKTIRKCHSDLLDFVLIAVTFYAYKKLSFKFICQILLRVGFSNRIEQLDQTKQLALVGSIFHL